MSQPKIRALVLKALGQASSFKLLDVDAVDLEAELKAAKETGLMLLATIEELFLALPPKEEPTAGKIPS